MENDSNKPVKTGTYAEFGFACFAIAVVFFVLLTVKESKGDDMTVHWIIALPYSIGGKWVVSGALALGGIGCFIASFMKNSQTAKGAPAQTQ